MAAVTILKLRSPCSVRCALQFPTASRFICEPIEVRYEVQGSTGARGDRAVNDLTREPMDFRRYRPPDL